MPARVRIEEDDAAALLGGRHDEGEDRLPHLEGLPASAPGAALSEIAQQRRTVPAPQIFPERATHRSGRVVDDVDRFTLDSVQREDDTQFAERSGHTPRQVK